MMYIHGSTCTCTLYMCVQSVDRSSSTYPYVSMYCTRTHDVNSWSCILLTGHLSSLSHPLMPGCMSGLFLFFLLSLPPQAVVIHDSQPASLADLSSQFFLRESDVEQGTNRSGTHLVTASNAPHTAHVHVQSMYNVCAPHVHRSIQHTLIHVSGSVFHSADIQYTL